MKRALIGILALGLALPVAAQVGNDPQESGCIREEAHRAIVAYLELSQDQVDSWDQLLADREAAAEPLRVALAEVQADLEELLGMDEPPLEDIGALVVTRRDLGEQLADVHRTYLDGFEALLDEDQHQRFQFVRGALRAQPLIPAYRIFGFLPPRRR